MTEDKIKEAFEAWFDQGQLFTASHFDAFQAGYMACLNGLEYAATLPDNGTERVAYFIPEGVTKP